MIENPKITYHNDSTSQLVLPIVSDYLIDYSDPVHTFNEVMKGINLNKYLIKNNNLGRTGYNLTSLFKIVMFAFMINVRTTRKIEDLCRNDIRFMWLSNNIKPSHNTIQQFIKNNLSHNIEAIFVEINKYLIEKENIDTDTLFIDGTKLEANANKYTFVWKKVILKNRTRLYLKISSEIIKLNNLNVINQYQIKDTYQPKLLSNIIDELAKVIEKEGINFVYGKGTRKTKIQRCYEKLVEYFDKLNEYDKHLAICGEHRNSYSKSDYDATFMRMKEDHMRNGQLKAGYNIQIGVSDEYILNVEVYQARSDYKTFIPFIDSYYQKYGKYPKYPIGDAGYGGYENYLYCKVKEMELYLKYPMYSKEKERSFKKQIFNSRNFKYEEDGRIICPKLNEFKLVKTYMSHSDGYSKEILNYQGQGCDECEYQSECTKAKDGIRKLKIIKGVRELELEAKQNLDSASGISLRIQRSIEVEGAFGVIKEDNKYRRISRRGLENVKTELSLVCLGYNLMKYHNKKNRKYS